MTIIYYIFLVVVPLLAATVAIIYVRSHSPARASGQKSILPPRIGAMLFPNKETNRREELKALKTRNKQVISTAAKRTTDGHETRHLARISLSSRLRYAGSKLSAFQFRLFQVTVTAILLVPAYVYATLPVQFGVLVLTPCLVSSLIDYRIKKRVRKFEKDYSVMLNQLTGFLKAGMMILPGLQEVRKGLDPESSVRQEIELLLERIRLGLGEEEAIGAFGQDIAHPEIELFVQSLILNIRLGGSLCPTLERLSLQVRKRQQFQKQAIAAIENERLSIYSVTVIMVLLMLYLFWEAPNLIIPALNSSVGLNILQFGAVLAVFGFYWSTKIADIKV